MDTPHAADVWASGNTYEPYVGRWSRLVAREFLDWLAVPPGLRWLDVGCGTGALTQTILDVASPSNVVGVDASSNFVAYAQAHTPDSRAQFEVGDALGLPLHSSSFDAVVSGLMLNFVPDPAMAVREMARVARGTGAVAVYVWDYDAGMQLMRSFWNAAIALDPAAGALDEGHRFSAVCHPEALSTLFTGAGLHDVETRAVEVPTHFATFDDYWTPFLGGQGPAPSYVAILSPDRRDALRERLRAALPTAPDGSISLTARAWAVRGTA